jgi:hypothetical protein
MTSAVKPEIAHVIETLSVEDAYDVLKSVVRRSMVKREDPGWPPQ